MTPIQNEILLKVYNDEPLTEDEKLILQEWSDDFWRKAKRPMRISNAGGNDYSTLNIDIDRIESLIE
jgi:hypothetical protein